MQVMSISVPTLLEPYDTQMLDYASDIDVPMHSSSFDSWYHGEVAMEDDPQTLHDSKLLLASTTVEVDMEDYVGESTEYEMADEVRHYQASNELLDVEVYDASQAHTPAPIHDVDTTLIPADGITESAHPSPFPSPHMVPDIQHLVHEPSHGHTLHPAIYHPTTEPSPANQGPHAEVASDLDLKADNFAPSHPEEHLDASETARESTELAEDPDVLKAHDPDLDNDPAIQTNPTPLHEPDVPNADGVQLGYPEVPDSEYPAEPADSLGYDQSATYHKELEEEYDQPDSGVIVDPHEISEGVYIDPPPAVFLSLPVNNSEVYLFNRPHPKSGANSPTTEASQPDDQIQALLLQQRPILYYEPLISVFEALRQEPYIAQIPELMEGELVLDAYDLQLVVSEDNIHAREVTLHDLNVLHDGAELSGPLRLHLQTINPRFIHRYHLLRDQLARSTLAADPETEDKPLNENEYEGNETPQHPSEQADAEETPDNYGEERNLGQASDPQEVFSEETAEAEIEEVTGDIHQSSTVLESFGVHGEATQLVDDQNNHTDVQAESGPETEAEEPATGAPRDSADPHPSAEGDTEDLEYTEPPVDGYNLISTLLPEEVDGSDHVADYAEHEEREPDISEDAEGTHISEEHPAHDYEEEYEDTTAQDDDNSGSKYAEETIADHQDDDSTEIAPGHADFYEQHDVDELDSNLVAPLSHHVELTDPLPEHPDSTRHSEPLEPGDEEWDDSLDGEGDPDPAWDVGHETESNQSSVTLSSTSSKRHYDEVEDEAEDNYDDVLSSYPHELKRPRVQ